MKKKILAVVLSILLLPIATSCDEDYDDTETWAVYWYLCASDLESDGGAATMDLEEMLSAYLPENVQVVIQTGGASMWENDTIDESRSERYLYEGDDLELLESNPDQNMGKSSTLKGFLEFCTQNYPADKTMVIFWNHGGGSVSGAAFDENHDYDSLTLTEFEKAFSEVFEKNTENPPIDIVGFDACLMATIDTVSTFEGYANYLVASTEWEPGGGWEYTGFLDAMGEHPGRSPLEVAEIICDTYYDGCKDYDAEDFATLSVTDLTKAEALLDAYDDMGNQALLSAAEDPHFFSRFGRNAEDSENYGGNTRDEGYANMTDLGDLALNCSSILPESAEKITDAMDECVVYQVNGAYHVNGTGLSCYYSYNGDEEDFSGYKKQGCSQPFKYLYEYMIEGRLSWDGIAYVNDLSIGSGSEEITDVEEVEEISDDEEYPLEIDEDGYVVMNLDQDTVNKLKGVYFELAYIDEDEDYMLLLGQDNDIVSDWENGIFRDNFRGVWGSIDGNLVYMEVVYEAEDYTIYSVPILLNDEEYNLRVAYDYNDEEFYIMGARVGLDDNGMSDKNLTQLQPGDEITPILYEATIYGDDEFEPVVADTFTVTEDTVFEEMDLGDGSFIMMFELVDAKNNYAYSQMVQFDVSGDDFEVEILE